MGENRLNNFAKKHAKKLLPLLMLTPLTLKAQESSLTEFDKIEITDSVINHPKYDFGLKPYVAESYKDLPEMSAKQAIVNPHKIYVGYFDNKGELQVIRTDCRYSAAAPDILTGVFRAECPHYKKEHITERHIEDKVPSGFTTEEYFDYVKSENNSLGEVIKDYCNFRKKLVKTPNGHKSIVVRAGFFQGGVQEWTACLRAAFCSSDVNAQKFASNFIEESSENLTIRDSVINAIYKDNELITGEEGVQKRITIRPLLSKLKVNGLSAKVAGKTCLSQKFCDSLKYYTRKQEFSDEKAEFEHKKMSASVKKLQEDYLLAWYLLAGKSNMTANIVDTHMAQEMNRKASKNIAKVTAAQVKEHGFGIYADTGNILGYVESNVNGGPYFDGYYKSGNKRVFTGFYKLTERILKSFIEPFNKNKILTGDFLFQAAVVGISGAQAVYEKFKQKQNVLQTEEQTLIDELQKTQFKETAPRDALNIPSNKIAFPQKIKIPSR